MKTNTKKITNIIGTLLMAMVLIQGCSDVAGPSSDISIAEGLEANAGMNDGGGELGGDSFIGCATSGSAELKASNDSYDAGTVSYYTDGGNLYVNYEPAEGVTIIETHLWVGGNLDDMPAAGNGAPKNGHFPYNDINNVIPLADIEGYVTDGSLYIVAHAVVEGSETATFQKEETAYAGEKEGDSKRWFWYIEAGIECVDGNDAGD